MKLFKRIRRPALSGRRLDYIEKYWGKNISWKPGKKSDTYTGHLWSPWGLKVGDRINVGAASDLLITSVEGCRDPRDMFFFDAVAFTVDPAEPASFGLNRAGDYV